MSDATPSLKQLNRTFIGSVLFIDIVGYSLRTVPDQIDMKDVFNSLLADAIQNVAFSERIIVDTGDGAGIAFLGDPEDALFAALSLRDAIDAGKVNVGEPGFVRMGINLGPLKIVRDINGHTNMIGDGVNDAQRVMSFSEPGQVMVSHAYYDIISRFSRDYAQLFVYEGTRHDKHVREHEVYRFGPIAANENLAEKLRDRSRARHIDIPVEEQAAPVSTTASHTSSGQKNLASRTGLIATLVGASALVGAVWSWTGTTEPKISTVPPPDAASAVPPETKTAKPATSREASKSVEIKMANKSPAGSANTAQKSQPALSAASAINASKDKAEKPGENPTPAVKPGNVKLAIQPWGEIYVDGSKHGISPPLKSLSLAPGKHRIEVRNGEFAPYKETLEVKSGGESTVHYVF
jgi:class 3 adenylate cyclase